jgi:hypothetical protein
LGGFDTTCIAVLGYGIHWRVTAFIVLHGAKEMRCAQSVKKMLKETI